MEESNSVETIEQVAALARTRVNEALKSTVELELLQVDPSMMAHSRVDHVVSEVKVISSDLAATDEALSASVWGSASEEKIRRFAERLASQRAV
jgi:hypothetical protein